jgi:glycosyltransferase involved in cell wall biosynthesis
MNPATAKRFPKTLVLSWGIPPAGTGSGIIMSNLLRQFRRDEMVAVGAFAMAQPSITWRTEWPSLIYGMVQPPYHWRGEAWMRRLQWPLLLLVSLWTLIRERCWAILAVYPDDIFLLTGYLLSRLTRRPLYAYFHNTYLDNKPNNRLAQWLQPRVFAHAKRVFVMSKGMQELFRQRYPQITTIPLVHTFNELLPLPDSVDVPPLHNPLRLVFIGNVNASCAEAAERVRQMVNRGPDVRLTIFSGAVNHETLSRLGFVGSDISVESVSRDLLLGRMREGDIVVHPHGFDGPMSTWEYRTIFPTRTIEYLICQRPILAHVPGDCFLARFYRQHQCALIVDEPSVEALTAALRYLRSDGVLRQRLVRNALIAARQFHAPRVADQLRQVVSA